MTPVTMTNEAVMKNHEPGTTLAIVVLHYGAAESTLRCVRSLYEHVCESAKVIVVDNGTRDPEIRSLANDCDDLIIVELSENNGWAGGCNAGIQKALTLGAGAICLLNNDTVVPNGASDMVKLSRRFEQLGPCLLHPAIDYLDCDRPPQLDPSKAETAGSAVAEGIYEMDHAYGACLIVPAQLFNMLGLFDERFFLQLEETDFYERARKAGYRSYCDTNVRIKHAESAAFGGWMPPLKLYYITRNTLLLIEKGGFDRRLARRRLQTLYWLLRELHAGARLKSVYSFFVVWLIFGAGFPRAFRRGFVDYLLRRFGRASRSIETMKI